MTKKIEKFLKGWYTALDIPVGDPKYKKTYSFNDDFKTKPQFIFQRNVSQE